MSSVAVDRPRNKMEARFRRSLTSEQTDAQKWGILMVAVILVVWAAGFAIGFQRATAVLTVIGLVVAVVGWRSPALALFGVGILIGLDSPTRVLLLTGGLLRWNTLYYWLVIVILLSVPFLLRLHDTQTRLIQAFIVLQTFQLLITPSITSGILVILSIVFVLGLYVYFARVYKDESAIYWLGVVVGVLCAAGGLVFYLQKSSLPYVNPNSLATFPLTGIFAISLGFPYGRKYYHGRLISFALASVNLLWVFLSGSRGNLLVALLCLLFLVFMTRSISWGLILVAAAVMAVGYFSYQFINLQAFAIHRLTKSFDTSYTLAQRTSGRSNLAMAGWQIFLEHPLGVGTGGFNVAVSESELSNYDEKNAHSAWIKVLAENGILGIILLVGYVVSFTVAGWKKNNRDLLLIGALVTLAFGVDFLSHEFQTKGLWFLAAGATMMLNRDEFIQSMDLGTKIKKGQRLLTRKYRLMQKYRERHAIEPKDNPPPLESQDD